MGDVAYDLQRKPAHDVEIVVHVDETLGEHRRKDLVEALEGQDGIYSAEFCPLRYHLMLVRYNRKDVSSRQVLENVQAQSVHAELVGPV